MAGAFNFTTPLEQCSNITMTWAGGVAPYEILLVPIGHLHPEVRTIINYQSIQSTTFSFPLTFPAQSQFVAILSDSKDGPGSGGTSRILTVEPPAKGAPSCIATEQTKPEFYFYLEPATPTQCSPWQISWPLTALSSPPKPASAQQNISIWAVVPDEATFAVPLPISADPDDASLDCSNWDVDLKAGTQVMLVAGYEYLGQGNGGVVNGRGKGGSTDIMVVGANGDASCLADDPPATTTFGSGGSLSTSTNALWTATGPTTTTTSGTSPANSGSGGGKTGAGARRASPAFSISKLGSLLLAVTLGGFLLSS